MTETTVVVKSGSVVAERPSQNSGSGGDERRWFRFVRRVKRRGFLMVETSAFAGQVGRWVKTVITMVPAVMLREYIFVLSRFATK